MFSQLSAIDRGTSICVIFDHRDPPNVEISTFSTSADGTFRSHNGHLLLAASSATPDRHNERNFL
ncbi:hypothetical protein [Dactylosporangium sp. CA-139066]|uniref:hypothetical protein n=1 Tax=Dactylosporangium sp. CA-139066 TaxID=3239930 RepID=UPI003D8F0F60